MKRNGFTVIELLLVIVLLSTGSWLFFSEKATVDASARDKQRKTAINAMYYGLEEYFYAKNGYSPASIGCNNENRCTGYTLRSLMEREDTYIKNNRQHKK